MNRHVLVFGTAVLSVLVIASTYYFVKVRNSEEVLEQKQEQLIVAQPFNLPDINGGTVSLDDLEGNVRVLNFWASWSPYSKDELTALNRLQEEYGAEISVIALSRDQYPSVGKAYLLSEGVGDSIMYVFDKDDEYFKKMEGFAVPETLFLNEKSEVVFHKHGPMKYEEIKAEIDNVLAQTW